MNLPDFASCRIVIVKHKQNKYMDVNNGPKPEALTAQGDGASIADAYATGSALPAKPVKVLKRGSYKPSHKATFIGLLVIALIIAVNVGIVLFVMRGQTTAAERAQSEVTLSSDTLNSLGVNKTAVGNEGAKLTVGPDSTFNGTVTIGKNVSIGGDLQLNNKLTTTQANINTLQAGESSLEKLTVNGDVSAENLLLRRDLTVPGATRLNGAVTVGQLLTVNNNLNVTGSLAVGGSLSIHNFQASSLTSDTTLTIGGHVITRGGTPKVTPGSGLGVTGTVTLSGSDTSGGINLGIGVGNGGGLLCSVTFATKYTGTPHVVVTPVGRNLNLYINRNAEGFQVYADGAIPAGGYAIDYIVMQ